GEGDDATGHVSFVVPLQVRLPRALSLELDAPLDPHFGGAGVRLQVEPHGHAGVLPALEGAPHGVEEARLEVGDGRWGKKHAYRASPRRRPGRAVARRRSTARPTRGRRRARRRG